VRVISSWDNRAYARELLAMENSARMAGKGLWGTGFFAMRSAGAEAMLTGLASNYEIVEGQMQNIAEIKGNVYINFGRNYRRDFTVFVSRKNVKLFNETAAAKMNRAGGAHEVSNATPVRDASANSTSARLAPASVNTTSAAPLSNGALSSSATPHNTTAKFDFASLKGQRIRVRGWLKNFNGPSIKVTHPEQIEVLNTQLALP
jgi:hypothetical protein